MKPATLSGRSIAALQMLRALAAMMVVVWHSDIAIKYFHFQRFTPGNETAAALSRPWWLNHLYFGVDIFFCLSGFIMAMLLAQAECGDSTNRRNVARNFWVERLIRILPPYWAATLLVWLVYAVSHGSFNVGQFSGHVGPDIGRVLRSFVMIESQPAPVLGVGWTLNYEFWFYALCALIFLFGWRRYFVTILFAFGIIGICAGLGEWHLYDYWASPFYFEFAAGAICFSLFNRSRQILPPSFAFSLAFIFFVIYCLQVDHSMPGNSFSPYRWVAGPLIGALLIHGCVGLDERVSATRIGTWLCRLGDASYALYLFHWFVLSGLGKLGRFAPGASPAAILIWQILCVCLAVVVCTLLSAYIEMPIHARLKAAWRR